MPVSERERQIRRRVCRGCRNDRYNQPADKDSGGLILGEQPIDQARKCRLLVYVKNDRTTQRYVCPYWTP